MTGIGALIIAKNEEANIRACLESVAFCDERVVVDSFSQDATVEQALPLVDRLYQRTFRSFADQKNWGLAQLTTPWVLIVDADERVPLELATELRQLSREAPADGFWIYRRNFFFGHEIHGAGWGRDRVLRFFRRGRGRYGDVLVHEEVRMDDAATVSRCRHRLVHYSYTNWPGTFERLLSYSTLGAGEARRRGRRGGRRSVATGPVARFFRQYVLQGGFRDGLAGYIVCSLSAVGIFLRRAKLVLEQPGRGQEAVAPGGTGLATVRTIKGPPPQSGDLPREEPAAADPGSGKRNKA